MTNAERLEQQERQAMLNAARQARHRQKRLDAGIVQIALWVPASAVADLQTAADRMRANPDLTIGRLVSRTTGKLTGLKARAPKTASQSAI